MTNTQTNNSKLKGNNEVIKLSHIINKDAGYRSVAESLRAAKIKDINLTKDELKSKHPEFSDDLHQKAELLADLIRAHNDDVKKIAAQRLKLNEKISGGSLTKDEKSDLKYDARVEVIEEDLLEKGVLEGKIDVVNRKNFGEKVKSGLSSCFKGTKDVLACVYSNTKPAVDEALKLAYVILNKRIQEESEKFYEDACKKIDQKVKDPQERKLLKDALHKSIEQGGKFLDDYLKAGSEKVSDALIEHHRSKHVKETAKNSKFSWFGGKSKNDDMDFKYATSYDNDDSEIPDFIKDHIENSYLSVIGEA